MVPSVSVLDLSTEVDAGLRAGRPIVALESTIVAHGMPWPQNVETATAVEAEVRAQGAIPATIAIVDGRLAYIDATNGTLTDGPQGSSGGGTAPIQRNPPPVRFNTQGGTPTGPPGQVPTGPTPPQITRCTLPGTTVITGQARPDVTSVTIVTPRDVRTVRPSGPQRVLIVVYDGQFFRGLRISKFLGLFRDSPEAQGYPSLGL